MVALGMLLGYCKVGRVSPWRRVLLSLSFASGSFTFWLKNFLFFFVCAGRGVSGFFVTCGFTFTL